MQYGASHSLAPGDGLGLDGGAPFQMAHGVSAGPVASTSTVLGPAHHVRDEEGDGGLMRKSSGGTAGDKGENGPPRKKQRKPRAVYSCSVCVKRKTKCDQKVPCQACIKRGQPEQCKIESAELEAERQPFALTSELDTVKERVATLEGLVASLVSSRDGGTNGSSRAGSSSAPPTVLGPYGQPLPQRHQPGKVAAEDDVAVALQSLSRGSPSSGIHLGHPGITTTPRMSVFGGSTTDSPARTVADLVHCLPNRDVAAFFVASFFDRVDWTIHILHRDVFLSQVKKLWANLAEPESPAFLALYLTVLHMGMHWCPQSQLPFSTQEEQACDVVWRDAIDRALDLADWSGKPQLRCLQAMILRAFLWTNTGAIDRVVVWTGTAIRVAQALKLHLIKDEDEQEVTYPNDDDESLQPALYRREIGKRAWWALCTLDWDVCYRTRAISALHSQDFNTPLPANMSDADLLSPMAVARPMSEYTEAAHGIQIARITTLHHSWVYPRATKIQQVRKSATTIDAIRTAILERRETMPAFFHDWEVPASQTNPIVLLQTLHLQAEFYCRETRIHRQLVFTEDLPQAVERMETAATKLLRIVDRFATLFDAAFAHSWMQQFSILGCAAILVVNIWRHSQTDIPTEQCHAARRHVMPVLERLRQYASGAHGEHGLRVVEALAARDETIAATAPSARPLFDAASYRGILHKAAFGSLCTGSAETLALKELADNLAGPPAPAPETVAPTPPPLAFTNPLEQADSAGQLMPDIDAFFRSLGLPPLDPFSWS